MEKVLLIGSAALLVAYSIFTEILDWVGRIEVIRDYFPKSPEFLERRGFRVLLLIIAIGLLIRVATEGNGKNAETAASPSPTMQVAPPEEKTTDPSQTEPDAAPEVKHIPGAKPAKKPSTVVTSPILQPARPSISQTPIQPAQPTYSVTNPTDSIVNQNSTNYGTQTIVTNPEWRIDPLTKDGLQTFLAGAPKKAFLLIFGGNTSTKYANDFREIASAAGWKTSPQVWYSQDMPPVMTGVSVCLPGKPIPNESPVFAQDDPMTYLGVTFDSYLKIPKHFCREPAQEGMILITFHQKPE